MDRCAGEAFNIGGGAANAISLRDLLHTIRDLAGRELPVAFHDWRASDQRYYVSDCAKFNAATGWAARVSTADGIARLFAWLRSERAAGVPTTTAAARRAAAAPAAAQLPHG